MKAAVALCFCTSLILSAATASAKNPTKYRVAVATTTIDGKVNRVKVMLNSRGTIVPWTAKKWGTVTPKNGTFFYLGSDRENSGFEWERTAYAKKNGYSMVVLGTTADEVTFGVNLKAGKGFFKYRDLGSGNGNSSLVLTVKEGKAITK